MKNERKTCFFIAPIGDEDSPERKRSNQVLSHIIEPVLAPFQYKVTRADQITKPGLITSQIIQDVLNSHLVIADLTGRNPNVFYELALRHAIRKPIIQMIEEGAKIPFDVSGLRTIPFNYQDLDSVARCKKELEQHVRAIEQDLTDVESPVTVAIDIERLRNSSEPIERYIAEAREFQSNIGQRMYNLELLLGQLISTQPSRFEYRQLPDGTWGNVLVMPPAISLVDKNPDQAPISSQPLKPSAEFLKRAMKALKRAEDSKRQLEADEQERKNEQ